MKKRDLFIALFACAAIGAQARGWLPQSADKTVKIRPLECTYDDAQLIDSKVITPSSSDWEVTQTTHKEPGVNVHAFTFTAKRPTTQAGVALAFDAYNWNSDNYVMIPASVYNGNRQRIVYRDYATGLDKSDRRKPDLALSSNPIPQLSPEFGAQSRLEVNVSNAATPAIAYLKRDEQQGVILLADQGIELNGQMIDNALIVEESADRSVASFVISAPGVRERKPEFIGFSPSPDRGAAFKAGDRVVINIREYNFGADNVPQLLDKFMAVRKAQTGANDPRYLIPASEVLTQMARNIDNRYYKNDQWEYYCPENADWISMGWIGGLMNTYPMLALGDDEHLQRVKNTFDFALPRAQGESGYVYCLIGSDGKVISRDANIGNAEVVLTRQNADVLYWMLKQFMLLKQQGKAADISPEWEKCVKRLADAFATTWNRYHTWGNYINVKTGEIEVYNTTSGAMAVGGMALAADYFADPAYMKIATEAAQAYYDSFSLIGFTSGGCGDILQNSDSETAAALMTSLMTLYESTGDKAWLAKSQDLANLCATWTSSFDYVLPPETELARLGAKLAGVVWASTQNKHGAPGFCTSSGDPLFKIYRATGDTLYADLMRDVIFAHTEGIQPSGQITERLTYCDADSRGSRLDGGKTGWNELNGALMALEIPGIYLRTDLAKLYTFDRVHARIVRKNAKEITIAIENPTPYDASVSILAEDGGQADRPLGCNAFLGWKKVSVKAGKSVNYTVKL